MNKYLITGYAGFVGYHFINCLNNNTKEKIDILGIDINEPNDFIKWKFENLEITHKSINLLDKEEVFKTIADFKPTYIIHLAALSSVGNSWKEPYVCFTNNTGIFLNICEAVRDANIKCRILCIGSSEEYGFVEENKLPITEDIMIQPANPYAVTKMAQESMAYVYTEGLGMDIICTRSFNHIGPRQRENFVVASFAKQVAKAFIDGKQELDMTTGNLNIIRDFLDVRDVVNAYRLLLENGKNGEVYNICSGEGIPLIKIIKILSEISGIKISTHMDSALIRPNDIFKIIGSNKKLKSDTTWNIKYTLYQTLTDTFNFWKAQLSK